MHTLQALLPLLLVGSLLQPSTARALPHPPPVSLELDGRAEHGPRFDAAALRRGWHLRLAELRLRLGELELDLTYGALERGLSPAALVAPDNRFGHQPPEHELDVGAGFELGPTHLGIFASCRCEPGHVRERALRLLGSGRF